MKGPEFAARGLELIEVLKSHILSALRAHPEGATGVRVAELQKFTGLSIMGGSQKNRKEVWLLGFYTLLIELFKNNGKIGSEANSLNTDDWSPSTRVWIKSSESVVREKNSTWNDRKEASDMKFTRITVDPEQMAGVPCIRRLRIPVATVVGMVADGMPEAEILAAYPDLQTEDIHEALKFAAEAVRERGLPLVAP